MSVFSRKKVCSVILQPCWFGRALSSMCSPSKQLTRWSCYQEVWVVGAITLTNLSSSIPWQNYGQSCIALSVCWLQLAMTFSTLIADHWTHQCTRSVPPAALFSATKVLRWRGNKWHFFTIDLQLGPVDIKSRNLQVHPLVVLLITVCVSG